MQTTRMSKLTFRADEELIEELESLDASKSEVIRDALRVYLDASDIPETDQGRSADSLEGFVERRIDAAIERRLDALDRDVNITLSFDGEQIGAGGRAGDRETIRRGSRPAAEHGDQSDCGQCGEPITADHVYCPNCGEKQSHRVFCDCGDELRTDWAFCPGCGRRTPAADVLE